MSSNIKAKENLPEKIMKKRKLKECGYQAACFQIKDRINRKPFPVRE